MKNTIFSDNLLRRKCNIAVHLMSFLAAAFLTLPFLNPVIPIGPVRMGVGNIISALLVALEMKCLSDLFRRSSVMVLPRSIVLCAALRYFAERLPDAKSPIEIAMSLAFVLVGAEMLSWFSVMELSGLGELKIQAGKSEMEEI